MQLLMKIREHRLGGGVTYNGRMTENEQNWIPEGSLFPQESSWEPDFSLKIGRPRIIWSDNIMKDIENNGVTWEEALPSPDDQQAKMEELDCPMCETHEID